MRHWAALFVFMLAATPAFASCLKFEPAKVTLAGVIHKRVDFGPPNFGEDPKHDSKVTNLYLQLGKSVCIDADLANDSEAVGSIKLMQMVYLTKPSFNPGWLDRHVSVTGTLFHSDNANHMTDALITPTETHVIGNGK